MAVAVLIALVITVPHMVADDGRLLIGYKKHDVPEELKTRRVAAPLTVLAVASLGVFMAFVDATIVNIAFPDIAESFPSSDFASLSWGVLQALGAALVVPSSLALVLHAYPAERRAHAVALLTAIAALAAGTGPSLGSFLVSADGWRLVLLVNVPVGIAACALARTKLVESGEPGRRMVPDLLMIGLGSRMRTGLLG